jgi:hypothetical protein
MSKSGDLITRRYGDFRGVDFSNRKDEVNINRSPDALNMWKNYKNSNGKCIETRPDVELLAEFSDTIFGLFFYENGKIIHSGTKLYSDSETVIYEGMAEHKSNYFVFGGKIYIMDGTNYLVYDGTTVSPVTGFIPTTTISRSPSQGGATYEDVNLLSPYKKNSFCSDGVSTDYYLDSKNIDGEVRVWIADNDGQLEETSDFTVDTTDGIVTFTQAPPEPLTVGQDNVVIQYKKDTGTGNIIKNCTLVEVFDNRVFASGNPNYPNRLWHCSLEDPTYWSDLDYYDEGTNDSPIKALVSGNNALWVLKAPSKSNTTIFYHNPTIDSKYGKIYPSTHSSISTGCKTTGINFNDTICFYSPNGLEAITSDVTTEQTISHKSSLVDSRLLNEENFDDMKLVEWQGYLVTIIDGKMYLADSRAYSQIIDHYEYEWFYFDLDKPITTATIFNYEDEKMHNGDLIICTDETKKVNGVPTTKHYVYALNKYSDNRQVESYWTTIEDEFNNPQYQKITNKKGCVVDAEGDLRVYARTDNKEYSVIKDYKNKKGYVVPRIKKKKWKSIQLKFYSKKPFELYSSTLESYIGSYIKR